MSNNKSSKKRKMAQNSQTPAKTGSEPAKISLDAIDKSIVMAENRRKSAVSDSNKPKSAKKELTEEEAMRRTNRQAMLLGVSSIIIIFALVAGFIFFVTATKKNDNAPNSPVNTEESPVNYAKPSFVTSDGGIVLTKNGIDRNGRRWNKINSVKNNTINHRPVVAFYSEALCAGCGAVERETGDTVRKWLKNDKVVYKHYPITILDVLSGDDHYSTRVAAMLYRVAELGDAKTYLNFLSIIMSSEIQPKEAAFKNIPDEKFVEYAKKAGLPADKARKVIDGKYIMFAYYNTRNLTTNKSLWRTARDGSKAFMTPIVVTNGNLVNNFSARDFNTFLADRLKIKLK